jgi:hypothetical protein
MRLVDSLMTEFENEMHTTRKHLERLPNDQMNWRPHEKSFTAAGLAAHITEGIGWIVRYSTRTESTLTLPPTNRTWPAR